jgi:hypothetical protein
VRLLLTGRAAPGVNKWPPIAINPASASHLSAPCNACQHEKESNYHQVDPDHGMLVGKDLPRHAYYENQLTGKYVGNSCPIKREPLRSVVLL